LSLNWERLMEAVNEGTRVSVVLVGFRKSKSRWVDEDTVEVTYMLGRSGIRGVSSVAAHGVGIGRIAFPFIQVGEWVVPKELNPELDLFEEKLRDRFSKFMERLGDEGVLAKVVERLSEKMDKSPDEIAEILRSLNAYLIKMNMKIEDMNPGARMLFEHRYKRHVERYMSGFAREVAKLMAVSRRNRRRPVRVLERMLFRLTSINQGEYLPDLQEALAESLRCVVEYNKREFPYGVLEKYRRIPGVGVLLDTASKPIYWEVF